MAKENSPESKSTIIIIIFNIVLLLASALFLGMNDTHTARCDNFDDFPVWIACTIMILGVSGSIGVLGRVRWMLLIQLFLILFLIAFLVGVSIFAYKISHSRDGYSEWMWNRVSNGEKWNAKKKYCLNDGLLCKAFALAANQTKFPDQFSSNKKYMRLKSGCCKPPESCKFMGSSPNSTTDYQSPNEPDDCKRWSDETLCLNCGSCKVAVLDNLKGLWTDLAIWNIVMIIVLVGNVFVGCYAFYHRLISPVVPETIEV